MNIAIDYTLEAIAEITNGKIVQHASAVQPHYLLLDSRKVIFPKTSIFLALKSSHRNAQSFIDELFKKGVRNFLVDEKFNFSSFPSGNFIAVTDTLRALHFLAIYHRKKFTIPVIGITGSNGKTVVKEWLNQLLQNDFNIARSPKSYNSQIGVPLSILQMNAQHTLGIFEAGISQPGEMETLEKIIQPTIGIVTNIGEAHNQGFKNIQQKINEKIKLFAHSSSLTFPSDFKGLNNAIASLKKNKNDKLELFTWSKKNNSFLKITSVEIQNNFSVIRAILKQKNIEIIIPFTDEASIENAISCWCILLQMNIANENIYKGMQRLQPVEMRLELNQGINNCSIINDSYSADITSLSIALDFLQQQKQHQKHTVILSDILQSGKSEIELYTEVASVLKEKNIQRLIAIGPQINAHQQLFSFLPEKIFFSSVDDFKNNFYSLHFSNENILLKGARVFEFEQINQLLEQKVHQTLLSINLNAIAHNLKQYRQLIMPSTKIMAMVKAFSYGSGYPVANVLQFNKVDYLAVAYTDEGVELRKAGITLPIMVLNPEENTYSALIKYNLEPEIFSFSMLHSFKKYLESEAVDFFPVHIKLDTGMHRLGFEKNDTRALGMHLKNYKSFKVQSVFSHLVASDDEQQDDFTLQQANSFLQCCRELEEIIGYSFLKHILNTSGISRHRDLQMDMVRLGIGLYGVENNKAMLSRLQNVTTLSTTISQIKKVKSGQTIGYGRKGKVEKDSVIATVRIGYADGYPRNLSNGKGKMLVANKLMPVIGNICMDMTMLNITGMDSVQEGDEVIVFGENLPIQSLAKWSNTISYEIMTGISQRVRRVYYEE